MRKPDPDGLTPKQRAFVVAYLKNGNNAAAAYRSAYDTKASNQNVAVDASGLLAHPKIAPLLAKARQHVANVTADVVRDLGITREQLIRNLSDLAHYDATSAWKQEKGGKITLKDLQEMPEDLRRAITAMEVRADGTVKVTYADKLGASVALAKLRSWMIERHSVRTIRSVEDLTDDELDALIASGGRGGQR